MTGINSYSTTASENVNANTGINWDEGMPPAAVNNSARQNMADVRAQWNDAIWFQYGIGSKTVAAVYGSGTSFTLAGADATSYWHAGRRVKAIGSGTGTIYGTISSSSYSTSTTTVNVTWDSGSLSNEALTIYASIVPATGNPVQRFSKIDVRNDQNGSTFAEVLNNNNSGNVVTSGFRATNSAGYMEMGVTGSAYGGFNNLIFDMGYVSVPGFANGFILGCAGPILFADENFVEQARFGNDGSFLNGTVIDGGWSTDAKIAIEAAGGNLISSRNTGSSGYAFTARVDSTSAGLASFRYNGSTIVGTITTNGTTTTYGTSSDRRLKNNIADSGDAGSIIDALRVRQWDWKSNDAHEPFGFVAQELVDTYPLAVQRGDDDPDTITTQWGRSDTALVALLVKEVQTLRKRLADAGIP